jgi:hypothetical protein
MTSASQARTRSGSDARAAANSSAKIVGRLVGLDELGKVRSPPLAIQVRARRSRRPGGVCGIERKPHHRLVVAHQRDPVIGADARRGADRKIDRAEAVRARDRRDRRGRRSRGFRRGASARAPLHRCSAASRSAGRECRRSAKISLSGLERDRAARILRRSTTATWELPMLERAKL